MISIEKIAKLLFVGVGILLILQLLWYVGVEQYARSNYIKTTATVVGFEDSGRCSNAIIGRTRRHYSLCKAPVYEYLDKSGNTLSSVDQYVTSFNEGDLFSKKNGDKVAAYYPVDNPESVFFRSGINGELPWLLPLYMSGILAITGFVLKIIYYIRLYLRGEQ